MVAFLTQLQLAIRSRFTQRTRLEVENLILRQQLVVLRRKSSTRVRPWNIEKASLWPRFGWPRLSRPLFKSILRLHLPMQRSPAPQTGATIVLRKIDAAGRPVRQIELCDRHAQAVIVRERARGLEVHDRRDWR
jgi:hypothetical protein